MTEAHDRFRHWLLDGAFGEPPRDVAVHAMACPECGRLLDVSDALRAIDLAGAGPPPSLAQPRRQFSLARPGRLATAITAAVVLSVGGVGAAVQLLGLTPPGVGAGQPEQEVLADASDGTAAPEASPISQIEVSAGGGRTDPDATNEASPALDADETDATPTPAPTQGAATAAPTAPAAAPPTAAPSTPRPTAPSTSNPSPSPTQPPAPTPSPSPSSPSPIPTPATTPTPTPAATPTPEPTPTPGEGD